MTKEKYILLFLMLLSFVFCFISIQDGHDFGGDFALYIEQAKAINNNSIQELYHLNKYAMDNSDVLIGPYLYPNGFPLILSIIYFFAGINFVAMKLLCVVFFILSLFFMYQVFNKYFDNKVYALFVVAGVAFHGSFLTFSDKILSDFPFLFFCFLAIYLIKKSKTILSQMALGFVIFYTYFTRDFGLVLLPTLIVYQVQHFIKNKEHRFGLYLIPYLVFAVLFTINYLTMPFGGENHLKVIFEEGQPYDFYIYYLDLITNYLFFSSFSWLLWLPLLFVIICGMIKQVWKDAYIIVFPVLIFIIVVMWPSIQGIRLLFPAIPFLLFFLIQGLNYLMFFLKFNYLKYVLLVYFVFIAYKGIDEVIQYSKINSDEVCTMEMKGIYNFVKKNTNQDDIIVFNNPRVLRLFTGRNSIYVRPEQFNSVEAHYMLLKKNIVTNEVHLEPVYVSEHYILYKKQII